MEESIITLEEQDPELHNLLSEFVEKNRKKKRFSYISGLVVCSMIVELPIYMVTDITVHPVLKVMSFFPMIIAITLLVRKVVKSTN